MQASKKDNLYEARSAIQKAIRRGDLNLAKTSFDLLSSDKIHWDWFKWRLPIFVEEEAWYMAGELAQLLKIADLTPLDYRKFIYKLVLVDKSKDTCGLWGLYKNNYMNDLPPHKELQTIAKWLDIAKEKGLNPLFIIEDIYNECKFKSDYEKEAMKVITERVYKGGMLGDRFCCIVALLLISMRGLDEAKIKEHIKFSVERYKKRRGKSPLTKEVDVPSFNVSPSKIKIVFDIFMEKYASRYNFSAKDFKYLWLYGDSYYTPNYLIRNKHYTEDVSPLVTPACFDSLWWGVLLEKILIINNKNHILNLELWNKEIRDIVEKIAIELV